HLMEPVIAKNYTISEDKKVIRVDINPNAYFSNGDKVTAYDVDYTYKLFMTKTLNTPYYKELTSLFENNDSIKAIDYDTVEFKFKKPYAFALSALSHGIINKKLVSQYIEENGYKLTVLDQALVTSTGPYMLNVSEFNTSKSIITLRPNPYWSITEKPTVNNLIFQYISGKDTAISALANGTVDIVDAGYYAKEIDFENVDVDILVAKRPNNRNRRTYTSRNGRSSKKNTPSDKSCSTKRNTSRKNILWNSCPGNFSNARRVCRF
ncbi:MAG: ABC transporter substrate-binding protein, partial [Candidatus Heimdallarchaeaceae archaeon]